MPVSEQAFLRRALEDPSGHWELHCGVMRQKPGMTFEHNHVMSDLFGTLFQQLDPAAFEVRSNSSHVWRSSESYYIPDVSVISIEQTRDQRGTRRLEVYREPLPLVVEIWSPSTGDYDVEVKLGEYRRRGDLEIWRIHPYERTLIAWRRQPDGSYAETVHTGGVVVHPIALPSVAIDLATLFA